MVKHAGLTEIDYLVSSHYHPDHAGGVPKLATTIPIKTFVDHGELRAPEGERPIASPIYEHYVSARSGGHHVQALPGDRIPIEDFDVTVVASDDRLINEPLGIHGAGKSNRFCQDFIPHPAESWFSSRNAENASSVGLVIRYGQFSMVNVGDLVQDQDLL